VTNGSFKESDDTWIGAVPKLKSLAEDADSPALEAVPVEKCGVSPRDVELRSSRAHVSAIDAGHHVQQACDILDSPSHRPRCIALTVERGHSVATHEADRRPNANEIVDRRWRTHASTGVCTNADHTEVRGDRHSSPTAGATTRVGSVIRIARKAW